MKKIQPIRDIATPPVCSYFAKPITNTLPERPVTLVEVYKLIKGDAFAYHTKMLRAIEDIKKAKEYKSLYFDYVTFSGIFSYRSEGGLKTHSGLLALDFDHIQNVQDLDIALLADPYF